MNKFDSAEMIFNHVRFENVPVVILQKIFEYLDVDSLFLCTSCNHSLRCARKYIKPIKIPIMGRMLSYWLSQISLTEFVQQYPCFKSSRLWIWSQSYEFEHCIPVYAIFEQLLWFDSLQELHLPLAFGAYYHESDQNVDWAPSCALKRAAFGRTLEVLHVHWSWLKMISLPWFIHLKSLKLYMHPWKLQGADLTCIAQCTELQQLQITWRDDFETEDEENDDILENIIEELQKLAQVSISLTSLTCIDFTLCDPNPLFLNALRLLTKCSQLRELRLRCDDRHSFNPDHMRLQLQSLFSGHLPTTLLERMQLPTGNESDDEQEVVTEEAEPDWMHHFIHYSSLASWQLERIALESVTLDMRAVQLLVTSGTRTLREVQLKNVVLHKMSMQQFFELLADHVPLLQRLDFEMDERVLWGDQIFLPLQQLSSLRTLRLMCPFHFASPQVLSVSELSQLTELEFNSAYIKNAALTPLLQMHRLKQLVIHAHHLKFDDQFHTFHSNIPTNMNVQIYSCGFTQRPAYSNCHQTHNCTHYVNLKNNT